VAFDEYIIMSKVKKYTLVKKLIWEGNRTNVLRYNSKSFYFVAGSLEGTLVKIIAMLGSIQII